MNLPGIYRLFYEIGYDIFSCTLCSLQLASPFKATTSITTSTWTRVTCRANDSLPREAQEPHALDELSRPSRCQSGDLQASGWLGGLFIVRCWIRGFLSFRKNNPYNVDWTADDFLSGGRSHSDLSKGLLADGPIVGSTGAEHVFLQFFRRNTEILIHLCVVFQRLRVRSIARVVILYCRIDWNLFSDLDAQFPKAFQISIWAIECEMQFLQGRVRV